MKSEREKILKEFQEKGSNVIVKKDNIYISFPKGVGKSLNVKQEKKRKNREAR